MRFSWLAACVVVALAFAAPAQAQFRNQAFTVQAGWLGLATTWDSFRGGTNAARPESWNTHDQPTVGAGHAFAVGYQTWIDTQAAIGFSTTVLDTADTAVMSLQLGGGLRYNFLEERHRPFVSVHLQTLTLIPFSSGVAPIPTNSLFATPFFGALRPGVGYEWVFGDEQSFSVELGFLATLVPDGEGEDRGFGGIFLPASVGRIGWLIYF